MAEKKNETATAVDPTAKYRTRELAHTARRVPLPDPVTGAASDTDWLEIVSSKSDQFNDARNVLMQQAAAIALGPQTPERDAKLKRLRTQMFAALVTDWSFPNYSQEAVADFLYDSPHATELVTHIADNSKLFFGNASNS